MSEMRWEDERYVRFYTRNTPEWRALSWKARGLFGLIMREVDRAGILKVGRLGLRGVAVAVEAPMEEIDAPLRELLEDGCVQVSEDQSAIFVRNFIAAQEAAQSDAARKRASRERALAMLDVTNRDHVSQPVTFGHSVPSVPSLHSRAVPPQQPRLPPPRGQQGLFLDQQAIEPATTPKEQKRSTSQKRAEFEPSEEGRRVLDELNRRRVRSMKGSRLLGPTHANLVEIEGRLAEGHTLEDLLHVAAVAEGKYHRDNESVYFNATTPYRAGNIARYLAEPKPEIRIVKEFPEPEPHERPMPFGITDEQVRESMARHGYDKPPDITAALLEWDKAETERKKREGGGGDGA